jgi:hypothetical protein
MQKDLIDSAMPVPALLFRDHASALMLPSLSAARVRLTSIFVACLRPDSAYSCGLSIGVAIL